MAIAPDEQVSLRLVKHAPRDDSVRVATWPLCNATPRHSHAKVKAPVAPLGLHIAGSVDVMNVWYNTWN